MCDLHERMEENLFRNQGMYPNAGAFEDWDPPDGKHTALILDYKEGLSKKKKKAWWKLECRMLDQDPELAGKEFGICYREAAPVGILKSAIKALAGRRIDDVREALVFFPTVVGLTINIQTTTNEKGYTNHRILGVVSKAPEAPRASQMSTKD